MRVMKSKRVMAIRYVRDLRGGSQPILVQGSDGFLYVVKFSDNLQGPNVAFNEGMGSMVFQSCGLPCPGWAAVWISDDFLDHNPNSWLETPEGYRKPNVGWGFGSRFLGLSDAPLLQILSSRDFSRIRNRIDFWTARVVDALCEHTDHRQALFLDDGGSLEAYFIDHGHLFGGPQGADTPKSEASRYLDKRIYPEVTDADCATIQKAIRCLGRMNPARAMDELPEEWVTPLGVARFERFCERISDEALLNNIGDFILNCSKWRGEDFERRPPQPERFEDAVLRAQIPASDISGGNHGWRGDLAGPQGRHRSEVLRAPQSKAAGF